MVDRQQARRLANQALDEGQPLRWFEQVYRQAAAGDDTVPWADLAPNPYLTDWSGFDAHRMRRALVVGCGYGDDAEWLAQQGCQVTAFDIAPSAVGRCRQRFPQTTVNYVVADLLAPTAALTRDRHDLVLEAYTVQVLPPDSQERRRAVASLARLTGDVLLIIARGRARGDPEGDMPWPITHADLTPLADAGLSEREFEEFHERNDDGRSVLRWRIRYER